MDRLVVGSGLDASAVISSVMAGTTASVLLAFLALMTPRILAMDSSQALTFVMIWRALASSNPSNSLVRLGSSMIIRLTRLDDSLRLSFACISRYSLTFSTSRLIMGSPSRLALRLASISFRASSIRWWTPFHLVVNCCTFC